MHPTLLSQLQDSAVVTNPNEIAMSYYYWNLRNPKSVALNFVTTSSSTPACKLSLVTMREVGMSHYNTFGKQKDGGTMEVAK